MNNLAIQEITEKLHEGTLSLYEKNRYKAFLEAINKFPDYSANNQVLIFCQSDGRATMVCGYNDWQTKHNRHVVKGGKGMKILAPKTKQVLVEQKDSLGNTLLDKNGNPVMKPEKKFIGFCTKTVFDVSQTAGDPIPSVTSLFSRGNIVDGYTEILEILNAVSPAPITFGERCTGYEETSGHIYIDSSLTQQQTIQKLLPSVASAILHKQTGECFESEDLEAESVAYIVANHYGINADYDFDYITDWCSDKDLDGLSASLKIIREAAMQMISDITRVTKKNHAA